MATSTQTIAGFFHGIDGYDEYTGRGTNLLRKNLNAIMALNIAEITFTYIMVNSHLKIVKYPVGAALSGARTEELKAKIQGVVDRLRNETSSQSYIALPSDFEIVFKDLSAPQGLQYINQFMVNYLAMSSITPEVVLRGSAAGEIASAEKNMRQFYEVIKAREQEASIRPAIKYMIDRYLLSVGKNDVKYTIEFPSIHEPTEIEKIKEEKERLELEMMRKDSENLLDDLEGKKIA